MATLRSAECMSHLKHTPLLIRDAAELSSYAATIQRREKQGKPVDHSLIKWGKAFEKARNSWVEFQQASPVLDYPEDLPVSIKRQDIVSAIEQHPVVIVCGDTGSGKTTQLPKMIFEAGGGHHGRIGVTQPRRLAATEMARRVASECAVEYGSAVGASVRFDDRSSKNTRIQFMTDGLLLAKLPSDPDWLEYGAILIDEAHERSLNIDFILGYLKQLLKRRPDLKVVISSATLDAEKFSAFFDQAPVLTVEGRLHPIQDVYAPLDPGRDLDIQDHIAEAIQGIDKEYGEKDALIFLPGEREIRETARKLEGIYRGRADILPLFARLGAGDQRKVFGTSSRRRIILATNVAETSLTIPGIRVVIDAGLVRIQRYHPQSRIQRLVTERVSQASARQRRGRCGRTGPGICVRLYDPKELEEAPAYTDPEIRRSSLSDVILRMAVIGLPPLGEFDLMDSPKGAQVNEGYRTLLDIGAMKEKRTLTGRGRRLATFHIEPRLARMLEEGHLEKVLPAVILCAAFLSIQDPRERPAEKTEEADAAHGLWKDPESDFVSILNLWNAICTSSPSRTKRNAFCRSRFLHPKRVQEWINLVEDLRENCKEHQWDVPPSIGEVELLDTDSLHRSILSGIPRSVGEREDKGEFRSPGGQTFRIFPGSGTAKKPPRWILSFTLLQTSRLFARECARIQPEWIEEVAPHLCSYQYERPVWNSTRGFVEAEERARIGQLTIRSGTRVHYGRIDPEGARRIFIRDAVEPGTLDCSTPAYQTYAEVRRSLNTWEDKLRRPGYFSGTSVVMDHLQEVIPENIYTRKAFVTWSKNASWTPNLRSFMKEEEIEPDAFPDRIEVEGCTVEVRYRYAPDDPEADGITYILKEDQLPSIPDALLEWVIPGFREEQIIALLRSLDKPLRVACSPIQKTATDLIRWLNENPFAYTHPLTKAMAAFLAVRLDRILAAPDFSCDQLRPYLRPKLELIDSNGNTVYRGSRFPGKQEVPGPSGPAPFTGSDGKPVEPFTEWPGVKLEPIEQNGTITQWPAITRNGDTCIVKGYPDREDAKEAQAQGLIHLFGLQRPDTVKYLQKHLPVPTTMQLDLSTLPGSNEDTMSELLQGILHEALFQDGNIPFTKPEYTKAADEARGIIFEVAEKRATQLTEIFELRSAVHQALEQQGLPGDTRADIELQLQTLWAPGWCRSPIRFRRYPKYLKGILIRLERCLREPAKDLRKLSELDPSLTLLAENTPTLNPREIREAFLKLEELRLSFFAPELKPHEKSSTKRFERWLKETRQSF